MFILKSKIEIGNYIFESVHDVEITKSVDELIDTAIIKLPTKFKIKGDPEEKYVEELIKVGDEVNIYLGYDGEYFDLEFSGFVSKISPKIPIEIHCEDALWHLRRKNITKAFNTPVDIKTILEEVAKDTPVQLADNLHKMQVEKFIIQNATGAKVLQDFKKNFGLSVYLTDEGKLWVGLKQLNNIGQIVKYNLNKHLVENNLEFKYKDERQLKIRYTYIDKKNKRKKVEVGDEHGELRSFHTSIVSDEKELKKMAEAELENLKYDGFSGNVKSFLIPHATRGMKATIIDEAHENRTGGYFINKVVTTFSVDGARRQVYITNKL